MVTTVSFFECELIIRQEIVFFPKTAESFVLNSFKYVVNWGYIDVGLYKRGLNSFC